MRKLFFSLWKTQTVQNTSDHISLSLDKLSSQAGWWIPVLLIFQLLLGKQSEIPAPESPGRRNQGWLLDPCWALTPVDCAQGMSPTKSRHPLMFCHSLGYCWPFPCHQPSHVPWGNKFIVAEEEQRNLSSKFFHFLLIEAEPCLLLYLIKTSLCQSFLRSFRTEQYKPYLIKLKEWQRREVPGKRGSVGKGVKSRSKRYIKYTEVIRNEKGI